MPLCLKRPIPIAVFRFNLNRIENIEKFCEQYATAICSLVGRGQKALELLTAYLSHLHPTVSVGGDSLVSVRLDYGPKMTSASLSAVLDMAERIAAERLKSSTVHAALNVIVSAGLVESDENGYCVGDPFFARYIRARSYEVR